MLPLKPSELQAKPEKISATRLRRCTQVSKLGVVTQKRNHMIDCSPIAADSGKMWFRPVQWWSSLELSLVRDYYRTEHSRTMLYHNPWRQAHPMLYLSPCRQVVRFQRTRSLLIGILSILAVVLSIQALFANKFSIAHRFCSTTSLN